MRRIGPEFKLWSKKVVPQFTRLAEGRLLLATCVGALLFLGIVAFSAGSQQAGGGAIPASTGDDFPFDLVRPRTAAIPSDDFPFDLVRPRWASAKFTLAM